MKEERDGVVMRGCEHNCAVHVTAVAARPAGTPQVAKCLLIFSVAILEERQQSSLTYTAQYLVLLQLDRNNSKSLLNGNKLQKGS